MRTLSGIHSGEEGPRKSMFVASLAVHVLLIATFPLLLASFKKTEPPEKIDIVFYPRAEEPREIPTQPEIPRVEPPEPPPPRPKPEPPVKTTPPVEAPVKLARVDPLPVFRSQVHKESIRRIKALSTSGSRCQRCAIFYKLIGRTCSSKCGGINYCNTHCCTYSS